MDSVTRDGGAEVLEGSPGSPGWLVTLLSTSFFKECGCSASFSLPKESREGSVNFLNIQNNTIHCSCCKSTSDDLPLPCLQIRRSTYQDVVRAEDLSPHINIQGVQCYSINQHKVVFLHARTTETNHHSNSAPTRTATMQGRCSGHGCSRQLMDANSTYCSLSCKFDSGSGGLDPHFQGVPGESLMWPEGSKRSRYTYNSLSSSAMDQEAYATPAPTFAFAGKKKTKGQPNRSNFE